MGTCTDCLADGACAWSEGSCYESCDEYDVPQDGSCFEGNMYLPSDVCCETKATCTDCLTGGMCAWSPQGGCWESCEEYYNVQYIGSCFEGGSVNLLSDVCEESASPSTYVPLVTPSPSPEPSKRIGYMTFPPTVRPVTATPTYPPTYLPTIETPTCNCECPSAPTFPPYSGKPTTKPTAQPAEASGKPVWGPAWEPERKPAWQPSWHVLRNSKSNKSGVRRDAGVFTHSTPFNPIAQTLTTPYCDASEIIKELEELEVFKVHQIHVLQVPGVRKSSWTTVLLPMSNRPIWQCGVSIGALLSLY